jgi:succinyl-diaminopimelate desuccinylase
MEIREYLNQNTNNMVEDIKKLIRIDSTKGEAQEGMPYGVGPAEALKEAEKIASAMGFKTKNYANHVIAIDLNDKETQLDILAHMDVVPAGDGWTVTTPFEPVVIDNKIYGRGAMDDKGPAIAALYAMKAIRDLNIPISKNVRLILGADEECGSGDLKHYYSIEKEAPMSVSPDADFPVINIEKGSLNGNVVASFKDEKAASGINRIWGGEKVNVIPGKAFAEVYGISKSQIEEICEKEKKATGLEYKVEEKKNNLLISVFGKTGHAASPLRANNAVTGIISLLSKLPLAECKGFESVKSLSKLFPHGDWKGVAAGVSQEDEVSGILTICLNMIEFSSEQLTGIFDSRCPICANEGNMRSVLKKNCEKLGLKLDAGNMHEPHYVPADSPLVKELLACFEEVTGKKGEAIAIGGGTYVHHLNNGVAFGPEMPGMDYSIHGPNEFAGVDDLLLCAEIYTKAIERLCK